MNDPSGEERPWGVKRLFAAASFSFLIVALVIGYHAYSASHGHGAAITREREILEWVVAGVMFVLSLVGARFRHSGH